MMYHYELWQLAPNPRYLISIAPDFTRFLIVQLKLNLVSRYKSFLITIDLTVHLYNLACSDHS